jgi:hypothetical protein
MPINMRILPQALQMSENKEKKITMPVYNMFPFLSLAIGEGVMNLSISDSIPIELSGKSKKYMCLELIPIRIGLPGCLSQSGSGKMMRIRPLRIRIHNTDRNWPLFYDVS